ncbi:MAG TPA: polysaccharide biosynthesis tyrosine autokinase [Blastocatellia bacterium]|nr:polysaccharide biosynthesis tyrosine autokinase [Blastocatellia bacterium]
MANERQDLERIAPLNAKMDPRLRSRQLRPSADPLLETYDESSFEESKESSVDLRELWLMVRRRKWLVLTIITIVTTIVAIQMYRAKSYYQANTIIEIGKESTTIVREGIAIQDNDFDPYYQVNIKTKMLMLTSRSLLEDVVVNLKLDQNPKFLDVTKRKWFGASDKPPLTEALPATLPAEVDGDLAMRPPAESARLAPYVTVIEDGLSVQQVRDTRAVTLSFTHTEPQLASQVANEIVRIFRTRNFEAKTGTLTQTEDWLKTSIRKVTAELEKAQEQLSQYTRDHNIVSLDSRTGNTTLTTATLAQYQDALTRAETDKLKAEALYEQVRNGSVAKLPAEFEDKTRDKITALQKTLQELQTEEARLDTRFGPDNAQMKEVRNKIAIVEGQVREATKALEEKLKSDYERASLEVRQIKAERDKAKAEAVKENQSDIKLNTLKENVESNQKLLNDLRDKQQQAELKLKESASPIRIYEPAQVPILPAGPRRLLSVLLAFFLSTAAAFGLAFFLEYLDNTIKTVEDVERYAQLPALGVIPAIATSTSLRKLPSKADPEALGENSNGLTLPSASLATQLMTLDNQSTVAEAYRALRTSVLLSSAGHPPKTILVTSGRPGEGKTTTAINTAISLAQLGASVLIIDCDLRRPKVHKVFGISHVHGLSTYLSRDAELNALVHTLPIPNLFLLPCGPTPPNPAELISSEKMREMLISLSEQYDHIILDSPPLINVTDPVILSTMVDGVIMVVHAGKSTRDVVRRASQELTGVGAKVFGVVLNNVNLQREGYDEYYYQRYYSGYYGSSEGNGNGDH